MAHAQDPSVLTRKIDRDRTGGAATPLPLVRALRLALARASRDLVNLRIDTIGGSQSVRGPDALAAVFGEGDLLLLLERDGHVSGAVALGPDLVRALVRQQTIGTPVGDAAETRAFTGTDAALCAPVIDALLAGAADLAPPGADRTLLEGHRSGLRIADGQSVSLALDGDRFRLFELTLDIGAGALQSRLLAVFAAREPDPDSGGEGARGAGLTLGDVALQAAVRLNAVLCRVPLAYGDLAGMKAGDRLPLPAYRIDRTELLTMSGRRIATGRLGKVDGLRAVRVNETVPPDPAFAEAAHVCAAPMPAPAGPEAPDEEEPLDLLDQDAALRRISELAGLDEDDAAAAPGPALP